MSDQHERERAGRVSREAFEEALAYSHLPTLAVAAAQAAGDTSLLDAETPTYDFFGDGMGDFSPAFQEAIRNAARTHLWPIVAGEAPPPPLPSAQQTRRLMTWIAGGEVPERYLPFLEEELGLDDEDRRRPQPVEGPMSAIVVGAGMSGLLAAYRLREAGVEVTVLEAESDVGGTWLKNRYPGVRVDTPNHLYSYSFEPGHDWPDFYSRGEVLLDYFRRFADRHGLRSAIRFDTRVELARWDEASGLWRVKTEGGEEFAARLLVSAVGQLNVPRMPDIEGWQSFAGPSFHSARWDHEVDLKGKRVAVVGTGASAFQFVPEIAREVAHLDVYQRSPPWLGPTDNYHEPVPEPFHWACRHIPAYEKWYRFWLFWMLTDGVLAAVTADEGWEGPPGTIGAANAELRQALLEKMAAQLPDRPDLLAAATPSYPLGGKRSLRDNGVWLKTLAQPHVELVTESIARVVADGVVTTDGVHRPADVLIAGTGFRASDFLSTFSVIGESGADLHQRWAGDARAYLGLMVPGFPNFFMIYGPNTNIVVNGSIIFFSECAVRFIVEAARQLTARRALALDVLPEVHQCFNEEVDRANARMAWGQPGVSSWYKNAAGRVSQNWPFALVDYWQATRAPDPRQYRWLSAGTQTPSVAAQ